MNTFRQRRISISDTESINKVKFKNRYSEQQIKKVSMPSYEELRRSKLNSDISIIDDISSMN